MPPKDSNHHGAAAGRRTSLLLLAWLGIVACCPSSYAAIPPRPADREFFHDLAGVVGAGDAQTITNLQQEVFRRVGVPIMVVTVNRMSEYDPNSPSIESFARRWFDTWGIGSQVKNDGMLVIVSTGDRKARIELGAEWERRFDEFCKRLMDEKMVPRFKKGDYGQGLSAAIGSLAAIAEVGPQAAPPNPGLTERILNNPLMKFNQQNNPIATKGGPIPITVMVVVGLGCFVAAIFLPQYRKPLLIAGTVLIVVALLFWIVVLILVALGMLKGGGGGGGGGGGSSGGGGASGSW
jgi:uncharacterized protein